MGQKKKMVSVKCVAFLICAGALDLREINKHDLTLLFSTEDKLLAEFWRYLTLEYVIMMFVSA